MGWLVFILLGLGLMVLMSRGRGGMGCCGVDRSKRDEDIHAGNSPDDPTPKVIELKKDEYTVLSVGDGGLPRNRRGDSVKENRFHRPSA